MGATCRAPFQERATNTVTTSGAEALAAEIGGSVSAYDSLAELLARAVNVLKQKAPATTSDRERSPSSSSIERRFRR